MRSLKKLQAVAHDLGHHAKGGLSHLHPHLGELCREAGVLSVVIELQTEKPYPDGFRHQEPLALALKAIRDRFSTILLQYGFEESDVRSAQLSFAFGSDGDNYSCGVRATVTSTSGRTFAKTQSMFANFFGEASDSIGA